MKRTSTALAAASLVLLAANVAMAGLWTEVGDAGNLVSTGQVTDGSGALTLINGSIALNNDADLYQINILDHASFSASTVGLTTADTRLYLFDPNGMGVTFDDDAPGGSAQSTITSQFVTANGLYWLAISKYPLFANSWTNGAWAFIWNANPYNVERQPDGPGKLNPLGNWTGALPGGTPVSYGISLTGSGFAVPEPTALMLLAMAGLARRRNRV